LPHTNLTHVAYIAICTYIGIYLYTHDTFLLILWAYIHRKYKTCMYRIESTYTQHIPVDMYICNINTNTKTYVKVVWGNIYSIYWHTLRYMHNMYLHTFLYTEDTNRLILWAHIYNTYWDYIYRTHTCVYTCVQMVTKVLSVHVQCAYVYRKERKYT